jgi:hypothetical protein
MPIKMGLEATGWARNKMSLLKAGACTEYNQQKQGILCFMRSEQPHKLMLEICGEFWPYMTENTHLS